MENVRSRIVTVLKNRFPDMGDQIKPFTTLLDEQTDQQISYPAPAILVCILPLQEAPADLPSWDLRLNFGLVVTVRKAKAIERDIEGWKRVIQAAQVCYRNTWGLNGLLTPGTITSIQKNEARDKEGSPIGIDYWTLTFYNYAKFEAVVA